jgi:hypothetical protein
MAKMAAPLHEATAPFPTIRIAPYDLSWEVFAEQAINQLMFPNVTYRDEYSGWTDYPLYLVDSVTNIRSHPARPNLTGWDFSTVNNHLSPWILYTRMHNDPAKRDFAMRKKDDLPLFYDHLRRMVRWGTRYPQHIGDVSMSWQNFFYYIETIRSHQVLAADDFNPAIGGRFLMGTEGLIEYAQNENYVFGQFFDAINKVAITQQDIPALGVIREPWQTGTYALIMLNAYDLTGDDNYLFEAENSIETLLTSMSFNVNNDYYNITYTDPADFPITELFGNAYGSVAAYKLYQLTGQTDYLQYSQDFLHGLLRLTFWYEDETDIYSRDLGNLGLFHPHGGAFNTTPWETTDAYIAITWLLKHYQKHPLTELLLKISNLYRINSFHYYPATYSPTVRALGVNDSINPYHPIEPFYAMEVGGHGGVPACYMANTGMWNYWMFEALAEADNDQIMTLNLDVLDDFEPAIASAQRNLLLFNPTENPIDCNLQLKSLAQGSYTVSVDYASYDLCDFDKNNEVGLSDLALLTDAWLQSPTDSPADIAPLGNPDGTVDFQDYALFATHWGNQNHAYEESFTKTELETGIPISLEGMDHARVTIVHDNAVTLNTVIDSCQSAQKNLIYAYKLLQCRERDFGDVAPSLVDQFNDAMSDYTNQDYYDAAFKAQSIIDTLP